VCLSEGNRKISVAGKVGKKKTKKTLRRKKMISRRKKIAKMMRRREAPSRHLEEPSDYEVDLQRKPWSIRFYEKKISSIMCHARIENVQDLLAVIHVP